MEKTYYVEVTRTCTYKIEVKDVNNTLEEYRGCIDSKADDGSMVKCLASQYFGRDNDDLAFYEGFGVLAENGISIDVKEDYSESTLLKV